MISWHVPVVVFFLHTSSLKFVPENCSSVHHLLCNGNKALLQINDKMHINRHNFKANRNDTDIDNVDKLIKKNREKDEKSKKNPNNRTLNFKLDHRTTEKMCMRGKMNRMYAAYTFVWIFLRFNMHFCHSFAVKMSLNKCSFPLFDVEHKVNGC